MAWREEHRGWVDGELALAGYSTPLLMPAARVLDLLEALHTRALVLDVTHTDVQEVKGAPLGQRVLGVARSLLGYPQPEGASEGDGDGEPVGVMSHEEARRRRDSWGLDDGPED